MIALADQTHNPSDLLTPDEAAKYLRLDEIGVQRPSLTLKRYRTRRGNYALRAVRVSGRTLYRRSDLEAFVESLQRRQDLSEHLKGRKGVGR